MLAVAQRGLPNKARSSGRSQPSMMTALMPRSGMAIIVPLADLMMRLVAGITGIVAVSVIRLRMTIAMRRYHHHSTMLIVAAMAFIAAAVVSVSAMAGRMTAAMMLRHRSPRQRSCQQARCHEKEGAHMDSPVVALFRHS